MVDHSGSYKKRVLTEPTRFLLHFIRNLGLEQAVQFLKLAVSYYFLNFGCFWIFYSLVVLFGEN